MLYYLIELANCTEKYIELSSKEDSIFFRGLTGKKSVQKNIIKSRGQFHDNL